MSRTLYLSRLRKMITEEGDSLEQALDRREGWRPREVEMRLTWACDARCEQCGMHSFVQLNRKTDYSKRLPVERIFEVLAELGEMGCESILFSGGEVTLVKELPQILQRCTDVGIAPHINTHGGHLKPEYCDPLLQSGLRGIMVSIDSGDPDQHDEIRKIPGLYHSAFAGVKYLHQQLPDDSFFYSLINFVIMSNNFRTIPRLVDAAADAGVREVSLSPVSIDNDWDDWANQGQSESLKLTVGDEHELATQILPQSLARAKQCDVNLMA